jgi:hypothetical protein
VAVKKKKGKSKKKIFLFPLMLLMKAFCSNPALVEPEREKLRR